MVAYGCQANDHPIATKLDQPRAWPDTPAPDRRVQGRDGARSAEDFPEWEPAHKTLMVKGGIPGIENAGGEPGRHHRQAVHLHGVPVALARWRRLHRAAAGYHRSRADLPVRDRGVAPMRTTAGRRSAFAAPHSRSTAKAGSAKTLRRPVPFYQRPPCPCLSWGEARYRPPAHVLVAAADHSLSAGEPGLRSAWDAEYRENAPRNPRSPGPHSLQCPLWRGFVGGSLRLQRGRGLCPRPRCFTGLPACLRTRLTASDRSWWCPPGPWRCWW